VLGPVVERWRRKKEEELARRRAEERGDAAAPPVEVEPETPTNSPLPYEDLVQEVFGPYIERKKREHAEAQQRAAVEVEEVDEEEAIDRHVRSIRETKAPEAVAYGQLPDEAVSAAAAPQDASTVPVVTSSARRVRTLDERLFANPRFTAGAKLLLASEILGRPKFRAR
jgi:hypothetical protein